MRRRTFVGAVTFIVTGVGCRRSGKRVIGGAPKGTDRYVSCVATDNTGAGRLAAQTLCELLEGEGRVAMVKHVPGSDSTSRRERGFEAEVAKNHPRMNIVAQQYCMSDRARALAVAEDFLTAHPNLDAMFCSSEAATLGASRALRSRNLAGKVKPVGFDASPSLQQDLEERGIDALVVQDPFTIGYRAVQTVVEKLEGSIQQKQIDLPARVIRPEDLKDPDVQELINPGIRQNL